MDDEEEDMSRPISQPWGTPFRDVKYEDCATQIAAGQALAAVAAAVPASQSHNNNNNSIGINNTLPCTLYRQPRVPFHEQRSSCVKYADTAVVESISSNLDSFACHSSIYRGEKECNAGLRLHFPAQFEPMEDRGERQIEEEVEEGRGREEERVAEGPEEQAGVSVEAQIGRKLREIGDKFQHDHIETLMRHQMQNLPTWMRLTMALFGFLFPREALFPRLRGEQR